MIAARRGDIKDLFSNYAHVGINYDKLFWSNIFCGGPIIHTE